MSCHRFVLLLNLFVSKILIQLSILNSGPPLNRIGQTMNCREHSNIVFETVEKSVQSSQLMSIQRSMHSDASKVRVKGPGLQKAFRNQKAQFIVDTREAGK